MPRQVTLTLDKPSSTYSPGEILKGRVMVDLANPLAVRAVRISIIGAARAHWADLIEKFGGSMTSDKLEEEVMFLNHTVTIWGNPLDAPIGTPIQTIPAGRHAFDFSFPIPTNCSNGAALASTYPNPMPSKTITYGYIRYSVKARFELDMSEMSAQKEIILRGVYDLSLDSKASLPVAISDSKTICCWFGKPGRIEVNVRLPKMGYVVGERITVSAEVINGSPKTVKEVKLVLVQRCVFRSGANSKVTRNALASVSKKRLLLSGRTQHWRNRGFPIPWTVPTLWMNSCKVIEISYHLRFIVVPVGCTMSFIVVIPILIGSFPSKSPSETPINSLPRESAITGTAPNSFPRRSLSALTSVTVPKNVPGKSVSVIGFKDPDPDSSPRKSISVINATALNSLPGEPNLVNVSADTVLKSVPRKNASITASAVPTSSRKRSNVSFGKL